jgi:plasmid stability protein
VIVDHANVVGVAFDPPEDDTPLVVDADRMKACQIPSQALEDTRSQLGRPSLAPGGRKAHSACNDSVSLQADVMAQLTVRNVSEQVVRALKQRAAAHGRSAEAEHREILRKALAEGEADFQARAGALRRRLRSSVDSAETIRADRDRDSRP